MKTKILSLTLALVLLAALFTGCTKTISYTYGVSTGDAIKVTLDVTNGLSMTSKTPIEFTLDERLLATGKFMSEEDMESNTQLIADHPEKYQALEQDATDEISWILCSSSGEDTEFFYMINIKKSSTGFLLTSETTREDLEMVFDALSFSKE